MKILNMKLENFQGIKTFEFSPDGKNASVYGDNGTGKTTLYNAFCWLWYGKASTDEKGYSPKTEGTHGLSHIVELEIEHNGERQSLKKDYHEIYKSKRGSKEKVFSGHTSDFYIDDVPVQEKDFKKVLDEICTEENAKLLTRYNYFLEDLKPEKRREILLDMCGGVDEAAIVQEKEFKSLPDILQGHSVEDYLKVAKDQIKKITAEEADIPVRIAEAQRSVEEVAENISELKVEEKALKTKKRALEMEKAAKGTTAYADLKKQIADAETELAQAKSRHAAEHAEEQKQKQESLEKLMEEQRLAKCSAAEKESRRNQITVEISEMKESRERLLQRWQEVNARSWNGNDTCPVCGQKLPEEQVEKTKRDFNRTKSEELERITESGKKVSKENIEEKEKEVKKISEEIDSISKDAFGIEKQILELQSRNAVIAFEDTSECRTIVEKINSLNKKFENLQESEKESVLELEAEIQKADERLRELQRIYIKAELVEEQKERIKGLEQKQKELQSQCEEYEFGKYLCEQFNRRKMELLEEKVNSRFNSLKFRLFEPQINGELKDVCEALIPCASGLIPFRSANNAARINAGLEMIDALSEHFGVEMPVWVDNAESVTKLVETKLQTIRLVVSKVYKELVCEYDC